MQKSCDGMPMKYNIKYKLMEALRKSDNRKFEQMWKTSKIRQKSGK